MLRQMSTAQRISLLRTATSIHVRIVKQVIRRAYPEASQQELDILFIKHAYGEELAARVEAYLQRRTAPENA